MKTALVLLCAATPAAAFAPFRMAARTKSLRAGFSAAEAPLVPRDVLFGNPEYAAPSLTPDGSKLAYLKPDNGIMNAWVRSTAGGDDRVVTDDSYRGIRQIFWAEDSKTLLYLQDDGGDDEDGDFLSKLKWPGADGGDGDFFPEGGPDDFDASAGPLRRQVSTK